MPLGNFWKKFREKRLDDSAQKIDSARSLGNAHKAHKQSHNPYKPQANLHSCLRRAYHPARLLNSVYSYFASILILIMDFIFYY